MKLVFKASGLTVELGNSVKVTEGGIDVSHTLVDIEQPGSAGGTGTVYLKANGHTDAYPPSAIGAEWIEREDQSNAEGIGFGIGVESNATDAERETVAEGAVAAFGGSNLGIKLADGFGTFTA